MEHALFYIYNTYGFKGGYKEEREETEEEYTDWNKP